MEMDQYMGSSEMSGIPEIVSTRFGEITVADNTYQNYLHD
jgi:hypothetical protein